MSKKQAMVKLEQVQKPLQFFPAEGVPAEGMPFKHKKAVTTWKAKYGITEVPLYVRSMDGTEYDDHKFKGLFFDGNYRRIVSRNYTVVPNGEIESIVNEIVKRSKGELSLQHYFKRRSGPSHTSHFGDAAYWEIRSSQWETIQGDDTVQIGCMVRNSVGTYVALGADLFTFRKWCSNGAIAKGIDLGSIAIKHLGDREKMLKNFALGVEKILDRTTQITKYYRKSTRMRLNEQIAEEWAKRIPQRCLPRSVAVNHKTGAVTLKEKQNLWEAFNDVTQEAWRPEKKETGFLSKHYITSYAHKVLIHAIDHRGVFSR